MRFQAKLLERFLIVGLGNPGRDYAQHRHNAGFMAVSALAARHAASFTRKQGPALVADFRLGAVQVVLAKPQTFMNESGVAVGQLLRFYQLPLERLLVAADDLDLPLGTIRLRAEGGAGGQRGLQSILDHAASQQVARLRIGIDRPPGAMDAADYVLRPFTAEQAALLPVVLEEAATAMECFVREGITVAMNRHNREVG